MPLSEWVHIVHWAIYIFSILAFLVLLTRWRVWGALWIFVLFFTQGIFHGCLITDLQNYARGAEGLQPIPRTMLTATLTSSTEWQVWLSFLIMLAALVIVLDAVWSRRS